MISTYIILFLCKYQGVLNTMLAQLFPIFRTWKGNEDMSGRNLSTHSVPEWLDWRKERNLPRYLRAPSSNLLCTIASMLILNYNKR